MSETSAPRGRKSQAVNDGQIILLPAPRTTGSLPMPRSDATKAPKVAPDSLLSITRRQREQRAAETARSTLGLLATGRRSASRPIARSPLLDALVSLTEYRPRVSRRLSAHGLVLTLACVLALNGGFPLHHNTQASDAPGVPLDSEESADNFQRVVIPMSATRIKSVGGLDRDEVVVDVGPALIKPAPQRGPAFVANHIVKSNETLGAIADRYAVSVDSLVAANGLSDMLVIGASLRIPRVSGVPHTVGEHETLTDIAARYGVAPEAIMTYPPNNLDRGQALIAGREIFVPGAALGGVSALSARGDEGFAALRAQAAALVRDDRTNLRSGPGTNYDRITKVNAGAQLLLLGRHDDWVKVQQDDGKPAWVSREVVTVDPEVYAALEETTDFPPPPPPPPIWVWPTWGDLTSGFGRRNMSVGAFHNGIDIANRRGTEIVAARSGTVIEAGWCSGYGYCVKMSHDGDYRTEYGHMMSRPVVVSGQYVEAGELIGYMGSTYDRSGGGFSTGNHLHFTVKRDGAAVNPLKYLP
ncbi:MAG TPA: peptidoglycan DD-metalloendopeptidase family protein [Herpetosiphonaceae bacterium]